MAIKSAVTGFSSNAFTQFDDLRQANILLLEEAEQVFASIGSATDTARRISTEENLPLVTADLRDFIAFEFSLVPEVEYVFTAFRENQIFYVWIVIDQFEAAARERIYARQQAIIDEFPTFEFDFYIIARTGRQVEDLVGDESMHRTYSRK